MSKSEENKKLMDSDLYSADRIESFERIFGRKFISLGGPTYTARFVRDLELKENSKVIDIGCGIGGAALHMAEEYGADVIGVDISSNVIAMANKYRSEATPVAKYRVQFHEEDATTENFPADFFDAAHSRDVILHIDDKQGLFDKILATLKPGGIMMITDYCKKIVDEPSESFREYVKRHNYDFRTVEEYKALLEEVGFCQVRANDITDDMVALSKDELSRWEDFRKEDDSENLAFEVEDMRKGWVARVERCGTGEQRWVQFVAKKP